MYAKRPAIACSFMRMQGITAGHQLVVDRVRQLGNSHRDNRYAIHLSKSENTLDNPLPYQYKLNLARDVFGSQIIIDTTYTRDLIRTPIDVAKLYSKSFTDFIFVCGSDRIDEFRALFNKYNGKEYEYESITVVSAGNREGTPSGSQLRQAVLDNDFETYLTLIPPAMKHPDAVDMWNTLKFQMEKLSGRSANTVTETSPSD